MKQLIILLATIGYCTVASAQIDSTNRKKTDTIHIGNIVIIKHGRTKDGKEVKMTMTQNSRPRKNSNISTNWFIVDLGFANYNDNTNYANTGSYLVSRPGYPALNGSDLKLKTGKSINVNIWFFMQKLNLADHYLNLKYGLGLELNNYRYRSAISYKEDGTIPYTAGTQTNAPFIFRDSISFSKNKLAADYLTVPLMLNFATNPNNIRRGISGSVGISAGYLYSQRNKQVSDERGKDHNRGDYDLEKFKISYIAELGLGPIRLYGSYSPKSMYEHSLDIKPYAVGIRLSNW